MQVLADVAVCLERRAEVLRLAQAGDGFGATAAYLGSYQALSGRSGLEWRLASLWLRATVAGAALGEAAGGALPAWPPDLLERPSGAALAFVVAQVVGGDLPLPPGLRRLAPIGGERKEMLARAWRLRPASSVLRESSFRRRFAAWLVEHPGSAGDCLLAAAAIGDLELVEKLGPAFIRGLLLQREAPAQILEATAIASLRKFALAAIRMAPALFFAEREWLPRLVFAAFDLGEYASALALCQVSKAQWSLAAEEARAIATVELGALAELDRHDEVVEIYRRRWLPFPEAFPHPEWLLYVFQQRGESQLERHLLERLPIEAETSEWIRLCRKAVLDGHPPRPADMESWGALYARSPGDERILVGVTSATLRCPPLLKEEWAERLDLRPRWRSLAGTVSHRHLAGAFLVLLQATDVEIVEEAEARLLEAPLALEPVRRAARAYVAALRRGRQWEKLRRLNRTCPDFFALACPFKEREMARVMAFLGDLPADLRALRQWSAGWERLLGLPLSPAEMLEVLDEFLVLRRVLEERLAGAASDELFGDVALQLLRRAKAEAEANLAATPGADAVKVEERRLQIRQAGLEGMARILEETAAL